MRAIIFTLFISFLWVTVTEARHNWKNASELERLRVKFNPPHSVIVEMLKKRFNTSTLPAVYVLHSDEIPSEEKGYKTRMTDLEGRMKEQEIIPDILKVAPKTYLRIIFVSNYSARGITNRTVLSGNFILGGDCEYAPTCHWRTEENTYYTLMYLALDQPHRGDPFASPFLQWLVVNIPGTDVSAGEILAYYVMPGGETSKGHHRHVFLVYKQPNKIVFNETLDYNNLNTNTTHGTRELFFPGNFSQRYNFGDPWAGNFFMSTD